MNDADKQVLTDATEVVIDGILSVIPGLSVAWGLSKALYGVGLKLRQQRALEWVEMVRDNPHVFTEQLLRQGDFQDGFVYTLEKYLFERNENKRKCLRNIFLNYCEGEDKVGFELERFTHVLSQMNLGDAEILKYVDTVTPNSYQLFDDQRYLSNVYDLINLGILFVDPNPRLGSIGSPYVYTSDFGRRFIKYLKHGKEFTD